MQIITKNIRWRALMETYRTTKFDRPNGPVAGKNGEKYEKQKQ